MKTICLFLLLAFALWAQPEGPSVNYAFATCPEIAAIPGLPAVSCAGPYLMVFLATPNVDAIAFDVTVVYGPYLVQKQLVRADESNGQRTGMWYFSGITVDQVPTISATALVRSGSTSTVAAK